MMEAPKPEKAIEVALYPNGYGPKTLLFSVRMVGPWRLERQTSTVSTIIYQSLTSTLLVFP